MSISALKLCHSAELALPQIPTDYQDDPEDATDTYGRFFSFRHPGTPTDQDSLTKHTVSPNLTMDDASPYVLTHTPSYFQRMIGTNYSFGFETDQGQLERNDADHTKVSLRALDYHSTGKRTYGAQWTNPLEVRLPDAPQMKVYCLYGHGKETEVSRIALLGGMRTLLLYDRD